MTHSKADPHCRGNFTCMACSMIVPALALPHSPCWTQFEPQGIQCWRLNPKLSGKIAHKKGWSSLVDKRVLISWMLSLRCCNHWFLCGQPSECSQASFHPGTTGDDYLCSPLNLLIWSRAVSFEAKIKYNIVLSWGQFHMLMYTIPLAEAMSGSLLPCLLPTRGSVPVFVFALVCVLHWLSLFMNMLCCFLLWLHLMTSFGVPAL